MLVDLNTSILLPDVPELQRPARARELGFDAVESWWPFAASVPGDREVDAWARAVSEAGVALVQLNTYGGPERGLAGLPGREAEWRDSLDVAVGLAGRLGCPALHVMLGRGGDEQLRHDHLAHAVTTDVRVHVEALSDPAYPVRSSADLVRVLDAVPGTYALVDTFHLSVGGEDVAAVVRRLGDRVGHVQVADAPGRHEPGTGTLDLRAVLDALSGVGHQGRLGLEYEPTGVGFDWLDAYGLRRSA